MHPRVCPHQVAFPNKSTTAFVDHCRGIGVQHMTLVTQLLMRPGGVKKAQRVLAGGGPRVATINHPFATFPNLESDTGEAAERLLRAIDNRVQRLNLARHLDIGAVDGQRSA